MINTFIRKSVLTVPLAAIALAAASSAFAATVGPSDDSFYNVPTTLPGTRGTLITYRPTTPKLGPGAPAVNAWNVIYQSKTSATKNQTGGDVAPKDNAVSGTVFVPTATWSGGGDRPVILYAIGTQGLGTTCAPSRQFAAGTEYENLNIANALKAGYAVLVTDYAGYLNGQKASYMAAGSGAHALLDIFKAATSIPSSGISPTAKVAIWGYSQGGQTAGTAGEILNTYAPELAPQVVGVAMGGVVQSLRSVSQFINGDLAAGFLFAAIDGLQNEFGTKGTYGMPISLVANDQGKALLNDVQNQCTFPVLLNNRNKDLTNYVVQDPSDPITLDSLLDTADGVLSLNDLGQNKISVPVYLFHGQSDEIIPLPPSIAYKKKLCQLGTTVKYDVYPGVEHIGALFQAGPAALSWIADRVAGKAAPSTCVTSVAEPVSNREPGKGNYVVGLNNWPLTATVHLKTLNQDVFMPAASTFSAKADITDKQLKNGSISIPAFKQSLKIIGIGAQIGLTVAPAGATTGSVSLDDGGILHIDGAAPVNITVTSVWGIPFGQCTTSTPVNFPLKLDQPISALGSGGLVFTGATSFPLMKGCIISAILSAFMSGSGQQYSFQVSPPPAYQF